MHLNRGVLRSTAEAGRAGEHVIEAFQVDGVGRRAPRLRNVEESIRNTIHELFGIASQQFYRHEFFKIDNGPSTMSTPVGASDELCQAQFVEGIPGAVARMRGLIDSLEEKREELTEAKAAAVWRPRGAPSTRRGGQE